MPDVSSPRPYESPHVMRLIDASHAAAAYHLTGSGAADECDTGNSASGACLAGGASATADCQYAGNEAASCTPLGSGV